MVNQKRWVGLARQSTSFKSVWLIRRYAVQSNIQRRRGSSEQPPQPFAQRAFQLVDRMVQQGLVRREESPADRRVRVVQLTDPGRKVVDESILARGQWMAKLMDTMNAEEKVQVAQALQILTEKAARLENGEI